MTLTVRLDPEADARLRRLARRKRLTKSEVVREALRALEDRDEGSDSDVRPYDVLKPYIGILKGGRPDLSERTGDHFRRVLEEKWRKRS